MPYRLPSWEFANPADSHEKLYRLRDRVEKYPEFFWVFDPHAWSFIYVGAAYPQIWGRARAELTADASSFFDAIHPDDRERIRRSYGPDRAGAYEEVYRVQRPDGTFRAVRDRAFPQLSGHHPGEHRTGLVSDITDITRAKDPSSWNSVEVALPADQRPTLQINPTQKKYRALFLNSADATLLFDCNGYVVEANHRISKLLGFERHELVRMHFSSLFSDTGLSAAVTSWEKVLGGERCCRVATILRKDKKSIDIEIAATLLFFGPEYIVQATFRQMPSQEQIAYELEEARDQLAQVQKMELIGQIASGAAHDFNNLMSVITGFTEVLQLRLADNPEARRDTEKILEAGESAALLVRRLLTLARHEERSPEVVDPTEVIERTCTFLERGIADEVSLSTAIAEDLWTIRIDQMELEQIIMNLGYNAGQAMPDGGVVELEATNFTNSPTTTNKAPAQLPFGRYVRVQVRDSGIGMDAGIRARIFEPFFTTKPQSRGTGLGLATVKNLVSRNKGFLHVESEPDQGSTFDVYFPLFIF